MAGRLADSVVNALLNAIFGDVTYDAPNTYYIGLSTTTPTNTGTNVTEPSGNGYARVAVTNNTTNWPSASGRSKSNGAPFTFPTATGSWGTVTHFVLYDAATAGTFQGWCALTTSQAIVTDNTPVFPSGAITVTSAGS